MQSTNSPARATARRCAAARLCGALVLAAAGSAYAQSDWTERILAGYRQQTPITTHAALDLGEAQRIQDQVVARLSAELGEVVGYKAALTSETAQERFKVDEPVLGQLLADMLRDDGARIDVAGGVHLLVEADLLVRIADPRITDATTPAEAFASIDRVAAFLEVPDIIVEPGEPLTGAVLTAVNGGARYGVMGPAVDTDELDAAALSEFTVQMWRNDEATGPESTGRALLGDPLNVVLWMIEEAGQRGLALEAGDWLSLGSLSPLVTANPGDRYRAVYTGLGPDPLEVSVEFVR